jgi:catechol 2,3-dioxygenase-like lactoylglutathione lyase family enzyme
MPRLNGIHHLTNLTADLDRLIDFYKRVFDAEVTLEMEEEGLRHALIKVGPATFLHPFQVPGINVPQGDVPMFERGRLDHWGVNAASEDDFWELRKRVLSEDAGVEDAVISDMGSLLSFTFEDPDGARHELIWMKPGREDVLPRQEWTTFTERPA